MKVDLRARRRNSRRDLDGRRCPQFLQFLRGRPCIFAGNGGCEGKIEAAHLDFAGGKGVGVKVADRYAVPLCSGHHRLQHNKGWQTFMATMGVAREQLMIAAAILWNAWPGRPAWERKQEEIRHG